MSGSLRVIGVLATLLGYNQMVAAASCESGFGQDYWGTCHRCPDFCTECWVTLQLSSSGSGFDKFFHCTACAPFYGLDGIPSYFSPPYTRCTLCITPGYPGKCLKCQFESGQTRRLCIQCQAGHYRDALFAYTDCSPCKVCTAGQETTRTCDFYGDRECADCYRGYIVAPRTDGTSYCSWCNSGVTYANANWLSCDPCSVCTSPNQYLPPDGQCLTYRNTLCSNCLENKATSSNNMGVCDTCQAGYFKVVSGNSFVCQACASVPCNANYYIQCANAVRQCVICPGITEGNACNAGYEPSSACDGTSASPSVCQECKKGTERPTNGLPLTCSRCNQVGFYKDKDGPQNCGPCTNKPQNDSVYLTWGNDVPSSANCPW
jgi:hypothetical protein